MKTSIRVSAHGGIVVRKAALAAKGVTEASVFSAMEADQPEEASDDLLSFGPSFGEEAMNEFVRRLQGLGLEYVDDFFCIHTDIPEWCSLRAELA
ncbi:MAG TPA: hypothetical protein VHA82_20010 [Ramlibacter sp.]|uniref:hypothetical protein n=1 Tax=Ramlibacter sp. TaxID=1917967 RepID=UPI002CF4C135|nr:hypothetical protein [Ramlibacter sp.]HVZ46104.1 hypothetical protein [Ramlibacter sp.]